MKIPNEDNPTNLENSTFENATLVDRVDVEGIESHLAIYHLDILCSLTRVQLRCRHICQCTLCGHIVAGWCPYPCFSSKVTTYFIVNLVQSFSFSRRQKKSKDMTASSEDENPVYGIYYFSTGQKIDDNNAEVVDENQYYES